jgi:hypothetical protein
VLSELYFDEESHEALLETLGRVLGVGKTAYASSHGLHSILARFDV